MADLGIFQLAHQGPPGSVSPFAEFGYLENPFPPSGLSGPLYTAHMPSALERINQWLATVQSATARGEQVPPLALRGALGVGKTHLLQTIESGLSRYAKFPVLRRNLTDMGMTKLLLANLLLGALPNLRQTAGLLIPIAAPSAVPLLDEIAEQGRKEGRSRRQEVLSVLDSASSLRMPLERVFEADVMTEADLRRWFALWLTRGTTTPRQRNKLGLSAPLEGEGQAISAIADLMRVARKLGLLQAWFVLIDQFEEVWRPHVLTEGRAARFLTDTRTLIDSAFLGAPIAVLLAWNTKATAADAAGGEDELAERYRALWQRLGSPIDLPGLRLQDLWPFAMHYLENVSPSRVIPQAEAKRRVFADLLQRKGWLPVGKLLDGNSFNAMLGPEQFAQRSVLQAWREVAAQLARERPTGDE